MNGLSTSDLVAVFIDGSNLYHAIKSAYTRTDIDLHKLATKLVAGRRMYRVYYYNSPVPGPSEAHRAQQRFFEAIRRMPYFTLRLGSLSPREAESECPNCGHQFQNASYVQKGVDAQLALDMLNHAWRGNYHVAVLVSGDADFAGMVHAVQELGRQVENAFVPGQMWARTLRETATDGRS
jgi:uncharacterized LabA/DUF88 family protein